MKFYILSIILMVGFSRESFTQDTVVTYFDQDWNELKDSSGASYFRKSWHLADKSWAVEDYFISGAVQMTGQFDGKKLKNKQGDFIYYYENGQVASKGKYVNGQGDGFWQYWFEDGNKKSEGAYVNGWKEGAWTYWQNGGARQSSGNYVAGKYDGKWTYYYEDDTKKSEGIYSEGLGEGTWIYYHQDGSKKAEGAFLNDEKRDTWTYWYENGQIRSLEKHIDNEVVEVTGYFENGDINYKGTYVNAEKHGEWTYWNANGRVYFQGRFDKGKMTGEWVRRFPSDEMKVQFVDGNPQGVAYGGIVINK